MKSLWMLIGEYASRCPMCFGPFLTNGYCIQHSLLCRQLNPIVTFQIIPEMEDMTLPEKSKGFMHSNYDSEHYVIEKFQTCKNQTFLVIHTELSGYFGAGYMKLIFGVCIDHRCYRKITDYLGVFYSQTTQKWLGEVRCQIDKDTVKKMHKTFHQKYREKKSP